MKARSLWFCPIRRRRGDAEIRRANEAALCLGAPQNDLLALTQSCELLKMITADLAPGAEVLVTRQDDALDAVIEIERRYACDLLVVGTRVSVSGYVEPSFAEAVVCRVSCSVLVMPLE